MARNVDILGFDGPGCDHQYLGFQSYVTCPNPFKVCSCHGVYRQFCGDLGLLAKQTLTEVRFHLLPEQLGLVK
jgi:hypothetical protein